MENHWPPDPLLDELDEAPQRIWESCGEDEEEYFVMLIEGQEQLRREGWRFADPPYARDNLAA